MCLASDFAKSFRQKKISSTSYNLTDFNNFFFYFQLLLFSVVGGILYVAASGVAIEDWRKNRIRPTAQHTSKQYQDMTISAGTLGLLTALVMFIDAGFILFSEEEDDD